MSTTVKAGWLKDNQGNKFAPKTMSSQVINDDGILLEDNINLKLTELKQYTDEEIDKKANSEHSHDEYVTTTYADEKLALKSDIENIDLSAYETKEDAQLKYDELNALANIQSDWNQNDETQAGYIKNRPFYEESDVTVIFAETKLTNSYAGGANGDFATVVEFTPKSDFVVNESYDFAINGVSYSAKCKLFEMEGTSLKYFGDLARFLAEVQGMSLEDVESAFGLKSTGESFVASPNEDNISWNLILFDNILNPTVSITKLPVIHKLDEKYIPDTIARTTYVDENFVLKSDLENIDLSAYETKEDAQTKLEESMAYTDNAVSEKADKVHAHDDIYYTETEIDTKLVLKSDTSHNHDSDYDAKGSASAVQTNLNTVSDALDSHIDNSKVHVTETEKSTWNSKSNFSGDYNDLTNKPTISASDIGLGNVDNTSDIDKPVSTAQQTAIDAALTSAKSYTDTKTNGMATTTVVDNKISTHNTNPSAHSDIRELITGLTTRLNALANSTDVELDQMAELVTYIKENRNLIEGVTTNKVNVSDVVDNLTTNVNNKPLSAAQGVVIKDLIDDLQEVVDSKVSSVSLVSGTNNGTLKLTVNGTATDNIAVKGLGSAAYTASTAYATSNHNHDDVYSKTNHNHNNDYYTKVENDNLLAGKSDKTHIHGISDITNLQDSLNSKANQTSLDGHDSNTTKHITSTERTNWNAAKTHADSDHDKYINQNAFSNIKVGSTTIAADSNTDTLELVGSNVTITPDATNDKVTIAVADGTTSVKGLVQLTNSTSSTSTTTAATPNSVKSAYDLANQAKTAATNAQTTADGKADANHIQSIDKGGTGCTSITDTTYTTARYRASSLHSTETNPSVNGVIAWTYE